MDTARRLSGMFVSDRESIQQSGRRAGSALRVYEALRERPILGLAHACERTSLSFAAASAAMDLLVERKIAREITGKRRGRLFAYDRYLAILGEGTEMS